MHRFKVEVKVWLNTPDRPDWLIDSISEQLIDAEQIEQYVITPITTERSVSPNAHIEEAINLLESADREETTIPLGDGKGVTVDMFYILQMLHKRLEDEEKAKALATITSHPTESNATEQLTSPNIGEGKQESAN